MKKQWEMPTLEVLEVKMTMLGREGEFTDADFDAHTPFLELTFS
ncbi:paeninodin family lasso peptide [Jeotgalibacillus soli]|uniref:Paeninodin family lasso peptide n=1 Tax=Jeotgalibacillus soli TaxID=889306 RepID=A0A0C2S5Q7_9BACL|nr:paeninodin family lasso peptide [Jeotgalibacillus soli]KIL49374.1 hypothetical protein KP78_08420 [Jeotgalibacillus soli]